MRVWLRVGVAVPVAAVAVVVAIGVTAVWLHAAGTSQAEQPSPGAAGSPQNFPLALERVRLEQRAFELRLVVDTRGRWSARRLDARRRTLCLLLRRPGGDRSELCLRGRRRGRPYLLRRDLARNGDVRRLRKIAFALDRPSPRRLVLRFRWSAAGLRAGPYRWRLSTVWLGPGCEAEGGRCADAVPGGGRLRRARLRPVLPVGCVPTAPWLRFRGSGAGNKVALTFDDGPAAATPQVLRILRRYGARATFFVVGVQIPGREAMLRRIRREGHEIGNHTPRHNPSASTGELLGLNARIRRATGFTPCLYRPPENLYGGGAIARARAAGMITVSWNVDPYDWQTPGSDAIYRRVVSALRPGGIVVMHDGGGPRGQTVAALPRILATLRARGYRAVTASEVLGVRYRYPGG